MNRFFENRELSIYEREVYENEHLVVEEVFNTYMHSFTIEDDPKKVENLIKFYNLFTYSDDNQIVKFIRAEVFRFYIEKVDELLICRRDVIVYLLMDLFYCDALFFVDENYNKLFFENSYPLLFLNTLDLNSPIAIASLRFIAILGSNNQIDYLHKYLTDSPNGIYVDDVKEEIADLQ